MTIARDWLHASDLPARWNGAERFVVLDAAFDDGARFRACREAWREHAERGTLHYLAITRALPADGWLLAPAPPSTPDFHRFAFDDGALQLLLIVGTLRKRLAQIAATVDAFWFDDQALAGDDDPAWPQRLFKAAARLAAPAATLALASPGAAALAALRSAGFAVDDDASQPLLSARYAPPFKPRSSLQRAVPAAADREVLVIGAGLAGCATAWALAEQGWHSTVVDRQPAPAREASGNPAGLFHGIVNPQDGAHARFNRAAALEAQRAVQVATRHHGVAGSSAGLLRLETTLTDVAAMQAVLQRLGLPAGYVQALSAAAASAAAGIALSHPCWHYPGGGWVDPAGLARAFLERAGARATFCGGLAVDALRRSADGLRWQALDAAGRVLAESSTVVLAVGGDAAALLGRPATPALQRVRGQLSIAPRATLAEALPGLTLPLVPVAGAGYLLSAIDGAAVFGATAQYGDDDAAVRVADHALNLAALRRLTGLPFAVDGSALQGRTAWRCVSGDRLPCIGAVADEGAPFATERVQRIPRLPGLYTFSALGSRGITWAALGAQLLASTISGAPLPLPVALRDAVDPARFALRRQRRGERESVQAAT